MSKIDTAKAALYAAGYSPRNYDATYCYWVKGNVQGDHSTYAVTLSTWNIRPMDNAGNLGKSVKPAEIK